MRIRLKYPDVDTFIQKYAVNISRGGIFIATKQPKPVGTLLRFEFLLANGDPGESIIRGEGQVQWTREFDPTQPTKAHGMGVRFTRLDPESQEVIDRALAYRANAVAGAVERPVPRDSPPPPTRIPAQPTGPISNDSGPRSVDGRGIVSAPIETGPLPDVPTQPDAMAAGGLSEAAHGRDGPTKEIAIPDVPMLPMGRPLNVETKPIRVDDPRITALDVPRGDRDDLDRIAAEWGLNEERLLRTLKRKRPRMVEATAELERLLLKPPRGPTPTKAEAMAGLSELLKKDPKRR